MKTVSRKDWAFCHAKMDISWFLYKKLKIFDRKFAILCENWNYFVLKYLTIPLIWYLICENSISRPEIAFIYVISANLVDFDFRLIGCIKSTIRISFCSRSIDEHIHPVNPFISNVPFKYPIKASENRKVFWCFQGV